MQKLIDDPDFVAVDGDASFAFCARDIYFPQTVSGSIVAEPFLALSTLGFSRTADEIDTHLVDVVFDPTTADIYAEWIAAPFVEPRHAAGADDVAFDEIGIGQVRSKRQVIGTVRFVTRAWAGLALSDAEVESIDPDFA